jgi:membrane-associated phospholipid phosphatase
MGEGRYLERVLLLCSVLAMYALYFPISLYTRTLAPVDVSTWVDTAVPLTPEWVFAYATNLFLAALPIGVVKDISLLRRVVAAYLLVEGVALVLFVAMPVQMFLRPELIPGEDFAAWALNFCYFIDPPVNCFPSLHVANATLGALICWKMDKLVGGVAVVLATLVCISILTVKQHFLMDGVAGFVLAHVAYAAFLAPVDLTKIPAQLQRYSRIPSLITACLYGLMMLAAYGLYWAGWAPWI